MRILALVSEAFGGLGGIAKYNQDFLRALCAFSGESKVIALPRVMRNDVGHLPLSLQYVRDAAGGKLGYVRTVLEIARRYTRPDLVVCAHINLLPLGYVLSLWTRSPLLLVIYGIDAWKPHRSVLVNMLTKHVDGVIAISEITKTRFMEWTRLPEKKAFVLPNAIHIDAYGPSETDDELLCRYGLSGKTVLMSMGRLSADERYKGVDEVMELLPVLTESFPDLAYMVVGDGSDRLRLEEKRRRLGLSERVIFTGFIAEAEKAKHYRLADAFVMPGRGEGFGFVFLEAMACGVPVVASSLDGSREAVRDGKLGIVVDPDNRDELKAGILEALTRPRGIVPEGLEYFSYANFERRLHRIIAELTEARGT